MSGSYNHHKRVSADELKKTNKPLIRTTLTDQVIERLVEFIENNDLRPGDPLPATEELAAAFDVSRPVIREALKFLEGRGMIEVVNGKRPMVKTVTINPLVDFFDQIVTVEKEAIQEFVELRQELEIQSAKLAARRRRPEELELMKDAMMVMQQHMHNAKTFAALDVKFHLLIAEASHNNMMMRLIKSIQKMLKNKNVPGEELTFWETEKTPESVQAEHAMILKAIERGDPDWAGEAMESHLGEQL